MSPLKRALFFSPWLYRTTRIVLGCTLMWAGGAKLMSPRALAGAFWDLLPYDMLIPVGLPLIELLAGLGLVLGIKASLSVITGLLLTFLALLGRAILDNLDVGFSPRGLLMQKSLLIAFYRDLGLMGMVCYLFMWHRFERRFAVHSDYEDDLLGRIDEGDLPKISHGLAASRLKSSGARLEK